jgi:hypothetical protein
MADKAASNTRVVLSKGAVIDVRVNDPLTVLGATPLCIGHPSHAPDCHDALGADYQTTVPFSTSIRSAKLLPLKSPENTKFPKSLQATGCARSTTWRTSARISAELQGNSLIFGSDRTG